MQANQQLRLAKRISGCDDSKFLKLQADMQRIIDGPYLANKGSTLLKALKRFYNQDIILLVDEYDYMQQRAAEQASRCKDKEEGRRFLAEASNVVKDFYTTLVKAV